MRRGTGTLRSGLGIWSRKARNSSGSATGRSSGRFGKSERGLGPTQELGGLKPAEGVLEPLEGEAGELAEFREAERCVGSRRRAGIAGRPSRGRRTRRGGRRAE